jgi:site-specific recombinase XerD
MPQPTAGVTRERNILRVESPLKPLFYVRLTINGKREYFGSFPSLREAVRFRDAAKVDLRRNQFFPQEHRRQSSCTLRDWIAQQPASDRPGAKNTHAYRDYWLTKAGAVPLSSLTPAYLEQVQIELRESGKSDQTVLHYLKYLRHLLNRAVRDALIPASPFTHVPLKPVQHLRERFLSVAEQTALAKALPSPYDEAMQIAIWSGLRWSEQFRLRREDVKKGYVILPTTKAGMTQMRAIGDKVQTALNRQLARHTSDWVYPNTTGTAPIDYANFRKRVWEPAIATAKLKNLRWHDLRHTFASRLTQQGESDRIVSTLLGHTSTAMVKRYAHLAPSHLQDAINRMVKKNG